jgi:pyridoxamine 5'-phosphate oxidase
LQSGSQTVNGRMDNLREHINKLRHDFMKESLDESMVQADAVKQFESWFLQAIDGKAHEPNAFVLSTVGTDLKPSARVLLLRDFNESGFVFYTNYNSRKSREIEQNPNACMTFFWPELERQVRVEGKLMKQSAAESDVYFNARPRSSQLGAWASPQSDSLPSRNVLDTALAEMDKRFEGKPVPRPEWWGGFVLQPNKIEFWQGRPSRLHDRLLYVRAGFEWKISRLAP